jgi:hypothetical protein
MKAALEAWGSKANLFHQGFAKKASDPAIIAATVAKPGVVLKRAVGTDTSFSEHVEFSRDLPGADVNGTRGERVPKSAAAPPTPVSGGENARINGDNSIPVVYRISRGVRWVAVMGHRPEGRSMVAPSHRRRSSSVRWLIAPCKRWPSAPAFG